MNLSKRKIVIGLCSTAIIVCATLTSLNHSVDTEQGRGSKMIEYANALGTESTTATEETTVSTTTTKKTTTSTTTSTTTKPTTTTTAKSTTTTTSATSATSTETTPSITELMVKYENVPVPEAVYTDFTEEFVEPQVEPEVETVDEPEPVDTETNTETNTETEVVVTEIEPETEAETEPETEPAKNICPVTGCELLYSATYNVTSNPLTRSMGVVKNFNGHRETWYSERVLPGYGLKIPGRHCGDDGTVRDENGYICVASDLSYLPRGSIVLTTRGPGKVYDTGCAYGTIDIYVNW